MSDPPATTPPYKVAYSERVRAALRDLVAEGKARGIGQQVVAALKELDRRLHLYPQFGEPLRDLALEPAREWVAAVPPVVLRYVVDEERRLVLVVVPPSFLPHATP
jgi:hypothetical protein